MNGLKIQPGNNKHSLAMGQIQSKRQSTQSQAVLVVEPSYQTTNYHDFANPTLNLRPEDASITGPAPPQTLNRISALVDPRDFSSEYSADDSYSPASPSVPHNTYRLFPCYASANSYGNTRRPSLTEAIANTITNRRPSLNNALASHRIRRNRMDHREFLEDPNRPLTIRERQERIRQGLEKANADGVSDTSPRRRHLSKSSLIRSSKSMLNLNGNSKSKVNLVNGLTTVVSRNDGQRLERTGTQVSSGANEAPVRTLGSFEEKRIADGKREWQTRQEKRRRQCKIHRLFWQ